jgi:predicted Ser/Thr protein kinase
VRSVLKKGEASKADLLVVDVGDGPIVVKDFFAKPWWARILGRLQIARELRAYRWLDGLDGIPRLVGRVDALALALELVPGRPLHTVPEAMRRGPELVAALAALMGRVHDAGVVHHDLRGRENLILRDDGAIVIVDLAGAVCLRPGGILHRLFFGLLVRTDRSAFLKWKGRLAPGTYTPEEEEFLRRFERLRRLWIFNRK